MAALYKLAPRSIHHANLRTLAGVGDHAADRVIDGPVALSHEGTIELADLSPGEQKQWWKYTSSVQPDAPQIIRQSAYSCVFDDDAMVALHEEDKKVAHSWLTPLRKSLVVDIAHARPLDLDLYYSNTLDIKHITLLSYCKAQVQSAAMAKQVERLVDLHALHKNTDTQRGMTCELKGSVDANIFEALCKPNKVSAVTHVTLDNIATMSRSLVALKHPTAFLCLTGLKLSFQYDHKVPMAHRVFESYVDSLGRAMTALAGLLSWRGVDVDTLTVCNLDMSAKHAVQALLTEVRSKVRVLILECPYYLTVQQAEALEKAGVYVWAPRYMDKRTFKYHNIQQGVEFWWRRCCNDPRAPYLDPLCTPTGVRSLHRMCVAKNQK
jgi:hypothetical protein